MIGFRAMAGQVHVTMSANASSVTIDLGVDEALAMHDALGKIIEKAQQQSLEPFMLEELIERLNGQRKAIV